LNQISNLNFELIQNLRDAFDLNTWNYKKILIFITHLQLKGFDLFKFSIWIYLGF